MHLILNAYWEPLDFELPPAGDGGAGSWRRWIDTALESPQDIVPWQTAPALSGLTYRAAAHSVVVLIRRGRAWAHSRVSARNPAPEWRQNRGPSSQREACALFRESGRGEL